MGFGTQRPGFIAFLRPGLSVYRMRARMPTLTTLLGTLHENRSEVHGTPMAESHSPHLFSPAKSGGTLYIQCKVLSW